MPANPNWCKRVYRALESASDQDIAAGLAWYPQARSVALRGAQAYGTTLDRAAIALAHLSPRQQWVMNVRAFERLMIGDGARESGILTECYLRARLALVAPDPWGTFGARANKTRSFALNITGDMNAVTVDTWISRVLGIPDEAPFRQPRTYRAAESTYQVCAKRAALAPAELQAITWISARGKAA
jgi:hypothetical protein